MTLEQAYKKVHMMDEVLDSDILNDEEYTSVAKRRFKLMELIGLEEQRQKQLETYNPIETYRPKLSDWERGFLDGFVIQGHKCHYITERQKTVLHLIGGFEQFQYNGYVFKFVKNALLVEKINEKSFLEEI
jgi:hypothetical protein